MYDLKFNLQYSVGRLREFIGKIIQTTKVIEKLRYNEVLGKAIGLNLFAPMIVRGKGSRGFSVR